jgi:hypothetical protein
MPSVEAEQVRAAPFQQMKASVIPAKAGIHPGAQGRDQRLDSRVRGNDEGRDVCCSAALPALAQ